MTRASPRAGDLEPIERASRDELQALQLRAPAAGRCSTPTTTCRTTGRRSTRRACTRRDLKHARRPREVSVHGQERPARQLPVRHVRGAARAGGAHPCVVGHDRQADRGRLHAQRHRHLGRPGGALDPRGGRPAGDIVHVAYGYGLFTGGLGAHYGAEKLGCTVIPMSGGQTEKQVQLIRDFKPDIIMVTPSYMLAIIEEMERQGIDPRSTVRSRSASSAPSRGPRRCAPRSRRAGIDAVDIYGLSEVIGPGVARNASRPRTARSSGRTTSIPRSSTRRPARCCPTARRASSCSRR